MAPHIISLSGPYADKELTSKMITKCSTFLSFAKPGEFADAGLIAPNASINRARRISVQCAAT